MENPDAQSLAFALGDQSHFGFLIVVIVVFTIVDYCRLDLFGLLFYCTLPNHLSLEQGSLTNTKGLRMRAVIGELETMGS